jgi:hypothetical protein
MDADNIIRRLRGAAGNAVVWGASWAALGLAAFAALKVAGILSGTVSWADSLFIAVRFGLVGGISGGAFSLVIGLLYQGRRLSDLRAVRFGIGGGIMAGLFVPAFMQAMNLLSGDGMVPMRLVLDDAPWAAVFGAIAAGGSLKLAQRAHALLPGRSQDPLGSLGSGTPLPSMEEWDARLRGAAPVPRT